MTIFAYGTYVFKDEIDPNCFSAETWNLIHSADDESALRKSDRSIRRRIINCMGVLRYLLARLDEPLTVDQIKHAHKMIMDKENHKNGKDALAGEYRKTPVFVEFKEFAPVSSIEKARSSVLDRHHYSNEDRISVATSLFADVINIHLV